MSHETIHKMLPILADGAGLLMMVSLLPETAQRLGEPSGLNALLLVAFYVLFCLGVYLIRKLLPGKEQSAHRSPAFTLNAKFRGILAFFFGLIMMTTIAYQIGYFASVQSVGAATLNEGDSSALLVYMPGALLGFSMLYILLLAFPIKSTISPTSGWFSIAALFGLMVVNSMLFLMTAQASGIVMEAALGGDVFILIISFLVLLLLFAPPRILYNGKQPFLYGMVSFLILLVFSAWRVAS